MCVSQKLHACHAHLPDGCRPALASCGRSNKPSKSQRLRYGWDAVERLPDEHLKRLIEETAAHFGEKFTTGPRGFLKVLVDILDEFEQNPPGPGG
jgi:hypothetical protein